MNSYQISYCLTKINKIKMDIKKKRYFRFS